MRKLGFAAGHKSELKRRSPPFIKRLLCRLEVLARRLMEFLGDVAIVRANKFTKGRRRSLREKRRRPFALRRHPGWSLMGLWRKLIRRVTVNAAFSDAHPSILENSRYNKTCLCGELTKTALGTAELIKSWICRRQGCDEPWSIMYSSGKYFDIYHRNLSDVSCALYETFLNFIATVIEGLKL